MAGVFCTMLGHVGGAHKCWLDHTCVQYWFPYYRKDVDATEIVQKRFIGMLLGMEGCYYKEELDRMDLFITGGRGARFTKQGT